MKQTVMKSIFGVQGEKRVFKEKFRIRRNYKDRLFIRLFQDKRNLLELYNALNDSAYINPDDLEITTLEDVVYLGMKNDCSFIIGSYMNLYEHQSTFCPNMPIRGLIYLVDIYENYIKSMNYNLYGSKQVKLPTPKYIVFYNGTEEHDDIELLRLSDAFEGKDSCLEFTAVMYNINMGHNTGLMKQCGTLQGYSILVAKVREYQQQKYSLSDAVDMACGYCIENNILREFLVKHRSEVVKVLLTEYNAKEQRKLDRRDAREEGLAEGKAAGLAEGRMSQIHKKYRKGILADECAEMLELDVPFVEEVYQLLAENPDLKDEEIYQRYCSKHKI